MAFRPDIDRACRFYIRRRIISDFPLRELDVDAGSDEVEIRKWPWTSDKIYPGITIHPDRESIGLGTCQTDDIGYGVGLTYIKATGDGIREDIDRISLFRAYVRGAFLNQKIPVDTIFQCTVEFGRWMLPRQYQDNYDASSMLVRCWSENERI